MCLALKVGRFLRLSIVAERKTAGKKKL